MPIYIPVAAFQSIRDKVRDETLDKAGTRWTDKELDTYINQAQLAYARRTHCLTGKVEVYFDGLNTIFQTPDNYIKATSFVNPDLIPIPLIEWKILAAKYSPRFLDDTSTQFLYCCFDYESWNRFRFYPNPEVTAGTKLGLLTYARKPKKDVLEISNEDALVNYSLFKSYLKERNAKYLKKAVAYRAKYTALVPKSKSRSTRTVTQQSRKRKARFF